MQANDAMRVRRDVRLVRDKDNRDAFDRVQLLEDPHDFFTRHGIQVAGGFIRQDEARLIDQRAGDSHALLLSTRHFVRLVVQPVTQPDALQCGNTAITAAGDARVDEGQLHVGQRRRAWEQVEALEDEADLAVANFGQAIIVHLAHVLSVEQIHAAGRHIQRPQDVHQGRFAGAGRAHDGHHLAGVDLQRDAAQGMHLKVAHAVDLGHVTDVDEGLAVFQGDILFSLRGERKPGLRSPHISGEHPKPMLRWQCMQRQPALR